MNKLKEIWNAPVWSSLIASIIFSIICFCIIKMKILIPFLVNININISYFLYFALTLIILFTLFNKIYLNNKTNISFTYIGRNNKLLKENRPDTLINSLEKDSELFIVGRTCCSWAGIHQDLALAICEKNLHVKIVIAENSEKIKSPVVGDSAQVDIESSFTRLSNLLVNELQNCNKSTNGTFALYTIPTYVVASFISYKKTKENLCGIVDFGIDTPFNKRVHVIFKDNNDQTSPYSEVYTVYNKLIETKKPIVEWHYHS